MQDNVKNVKEGVPYALKVLILLAGALAFWGMIGFSIASLVNPNALWAALGCLGIFVFALWVIIKH